MPNNSAASEFPPLFTPPLSMALPPHLVASREDLPDDA